MLSLQRLRVLRAVGDHGSLTRAAADLDYTQPAVSQHIAALELHFGMPLVIRQPRGVTLTPAGRALYDHAGEILQQIKVAERELAAMAGVESGTLRIASFPTAGAAIMPRAIAEFRRRHEGVEIQFHEWETDVSVPRLAAGDLDLAVVFDYEVAPLEETATLQFRPLMDDPLLVALPAGHPLAGCQEIDLAELSDETWIGGDAYSCRRVVEELCHQAGFDPCVAFESDDYGTVQGLVAEGIGIALLPALAAISIRPDVVVVPLTGPAGPRRLFVALPAGDYLLPAAEAMSEVLATVAPRVLEKRLLVGSGA